MTAEASRHGGQQDIRIVKYNNGYYGTVKLFGVSARVTQIHSGTAPPMCAIMITPEATVIRGMLCLSVFLGLLAGCSPKELPSTPQFTICGQVVDRHTQKPVKHFRAAILPGRPISGAPPGETAEFPEVESYRYDDKGRLHAPDGSSDVYITNVSDFTDVSDDAGRFCLSSGTAKNGEITVFVLCDHYVASHSVFTISASKDSRANIGLIQLQELQGSDQSRDHQ